MTMSKRPDTERRVNPDRRQKVTSPWSLRSLTGRRTYARRKEDRRKHHYVDRYGPRSLLVVLFVLIFCILDAVFTLRLISMGAKEINPVMDFFLRYGPLTFLLVKYGLTGLCLVWFVVHKNFLFLGGRLNVKYILLGILILYAVLIVYELYLLNLLGGWE